VTDPTLKNERVGKTLQELADAVGGTVQSSPDVVITGVASISEAVEGDIVLAESERFMAQAGESDASAVLATGAFETKPVIVVDNPRRAFIRILEIFAPDAGRPEPGVDPTSHVGERVTIGIGASVGYGCWIGDGVTIGDDTVVHPFSYIGEGVRIGAQSVVHPRVTIYRGCEMVSCDSAFRNGDRR
jgi:UDP-3-O-[3-hydroxymyristoyl] glucosamine N-acyltransferase